MIDQDAKYRAVAVWAGLRVIYGDNFLAVQGTEPSWEWLQAIDQLTDAQAKAALEHLARQPESEKKFPVNVARFMAAARRAMQSGSQSQGSAPPSASVRQFYLDKMREGLGVAKKPAEREPF